MSTIYKQKICDAIEDHGIEYVKINGLWIQFSKTSKAKRIVLPAVINALEETLKHKKQNDVQ